MTEKEAINRFEKAHFLNEQIDMQKDINEIATILSQNPISIDQVNEKIEKINKSHPENIILNYIIFPPHKPSFNGENISVQNLINDLTWKRIYLQAKKVGKLFDDFCKEMRKAYKNS